MYNNYCFSVEGGSPANVCIQLRWYDPLFGRVFVCFCQAIRTPDYLRQSVHFYTPSRHLRSTSQPLLSKPPTRTMISSRASKARENIIVLVVQLSVMGTRPTSQDQDQDQCYKTKTAVLFLQYGTLYLTTLAQLTVSDELDSHCVLTSTHSHFTNSPCDRLRP